MRAKDTKDIKYPPSNHIYIFKRIIKTKITVSKKKRKLEIPYL